ncbi:MAG TPA: class I SAM-dependent methyltransferase [Anaerolineae bacterium]
MVMNLSHAGVTDWGLRHVRIEPRFIILDVGCGGGRTVQKMAGVATQGRIYGIDSADGSVAASRDKNAQLIKTGRVEIQQASVSHLPFLDNYFDLVSAVETHYYWSDLVKDMQEILRVLKPGAAFVIIAESYSRGNKHDKLQWLESKLLKFRKLSIDEHREMFLSSGFSDVQIFEERNKGWICAIGNKPI